MDSKSKLESKNPNKIQSAKIQVSKISKASKDLVKLESQNILESNPKLDSKSLQKSNKESESKQAKKIQRAKTCDSKKLTNSQKSKLKSFIRTIPISIALASALSSQAVAAWTYNGSNVINNGTIGSQLNMGGGNYISLTNDKSAPNLTFNANVTQGNSAIQGVPDNAAIYVGNGAIGGTITNNAIYTVGGGSKRGLVVSGANTTLQAFVNNGTALQTDGQPLLYLKQGGTIQNIINNGEMINSGGSAGWAAVITLESDGANVVNNVVFNNNSVTSHTAGNHRNIIIIRNSRSTIGNITANGNAELNGNFTFGAGTITNGITFNGTSAMTGNISSSGRIGSIVLNDSSTIKGNISLTGGANIVNGISLLDSASITNGISLADSSRISKILIDGSNSGGANGTPKLDGNITLNTSNEITNGITIANGGTLDGNINARNSSSIGGVVVDDGTIVGDIIASGTSRLNGITIVNGGEMQGNIIGQHVSGSSGNAMNLGNIDIQSRLQGGITLANGATIESLSLSNRGTITNAVSIGASGSNNQTSILKTITLNGASGINSLVVGSSSDNAGTINSITLGGNSSIGSINVAERGTIANLEIGNASQVGSIGSITNAGKLQNITLNNTSTITNGITNNSGGTISNITLASSNTINNGIKNDGVITEINHNVAGVENAVTNNAGGSISKLIISQGTIEYNGEGDITEELSVKGGATLSMNAGSGTITMNGAVGSKLNLESGSTFKGSLKNTGSISSWSNVSNIEGSFINDAGANIGSLSAGQIAENLLNKGNIGDLTIDNVVGTLSNESEITTLSVQNRVANGILIVEIFKLLRLQIVQIWEVLGLAMMV